MAKWHFLFRDRSLTAYEKLVGAAYAGRQQKDNWITIDKRVIAADCSISVRQLERTKKSLEDLGILLRKVERAPSGDMVTLYRIIQRQGLMFEKKDEKPPGTATISRIYPNTQNHQKQKPAARSCASPKELEDRKKIERQMRREKFEAAARVKDGAVLAEAHVGTAPRPSRAWLERKQAQQILAQR